MSNIEQIKAQSNTLTTKQLVNYFQKFYTGDNQFYYFANNLVRCVQDLFTAWIEDDRYKKLFSSSGYNGVYCLNGVFIFGGVEHADHFQMVLSSIKGSVITLTDPHFKNDKDLLVTFQCSQLNYYKVAQKAISQIISNRQCDACLFYNQLQAKGPEAFKVIIKTHNMDDVADFLQILIGR